VPQLPENLGVFSDEVHEVAEPDDDEPTGGPSGI
jgi:hypothetical protein